MAATFLNPASVYNFDSAETDAEFDVGDLSNENKNTKRKTETDMRIFSAYLVSLKEMRKAEDIPPQELDPYLSMFFSVVKKHDGHEYEPASLRGMLCSIERYLRMKGYQCSITRDAAFSNTRNTLKSKQRILRENGKGIKKLIPCAGPEPLGPSTMEKLNHLYSAKELGPYNPMSVINSICFAFVLNLKMRKAIEHKQLLWGDIVLKSSPTGEYLCYEPLEGKEYIRQKLKGIEDCSVWSNPVSGPNKDTILIYKLYSQKRPAQMMSPESPFYLGVSTSHPVHNQPWYKSLPMGVNKLNDLVRMIRDITGIQKSQTYSNPGSPDDVTRGYTASPSMKSFDIQHGAKLVTDEINESKAMDGPNSLSKVDTSVTSFNQSVTGNHNTSRYDIAIYDNAEHEMGRSYGRFATSDLGLNDAKSPDHAVDGRLIETSGQADSNDTGISIDEAKLLIQGLVEKVDSDKREELVEWMNTLQPNIGKYKTDSKQQRRHYQIILDLNTNDLNMCHDLELSGRLKLVGESVDEITTSCSNDEPTNSYTSSASQINSSNDTTSLVDYATPGDTSLTEKSYCGVLEDQDCINASYNSLTSTSSVLKRSVSERPCPTSYDRAESKRIKLGRSFSWQDPITGRDSCSTLSYKETEIETSKQDNGEKNNAYILDNTSNEEARMDKVNLTSPPVSVQATCSNPVANTPFQREMFAPHWIPPQIFQQFAFHSLAPYANPRWLQLYRQNAEVPSMESVFRQPFDTNLLKRVYANTATDHKANITTASQFDNYQVTSAHCDKPSASVQYGQVASTSCNNPAVNVYYNQGVDTLRSESEDIPIS